MTYGFSATNGSNHQTIDGSNKGYKLHSVGTILTATAGGGTVNSQTGDPVDHYIPVPSAEALVFFKPQQFSASEMYGGMVYSDPVSSSSLRFAVMCGNIKGGLPQLRTVNYRIYVPVETSDYTPTGFGLVVRNESNNIILSTDIVASIPILATINMTVTFPTTNTSSTFYVDAGVDAWSLATGLVPFWIYAKFSTNNGPIYLNQLYFVVGVFFISASEIKVSTAYSIQNTSSQPSHKYTAMVAQI